MLTVRHRSRDQLSENAWHAALWWEQPPELRMRNHQSILEHAGFVEGELLESLRSGALSDLVVSFARSCPWLSNEPCSQVQAHLRCECFSG
jgi:hypothetical protein